MKTTLLINTGESSSAKVGLKTDFGVWEKTLDKDQKSSQTILPALKELMHENKLDLNDLDAIELYTGPGSFTGLRVGAAVATTLSLILNIPINNLPAGQLPEINYGKDVWGLA